MNLEERIGLLEKEIRELAQEHTATQQRLMRLYDELRVLKTQVSGTMIAQGPGVDPVDRQVGDTTPEPGSSAPAEGGLEHFIGLKLIHLAGIIVLLTGISIGVKYAIDKDLISPLARIILAYLAGVVLFAISFRLKGKYNFFSAILFSGSMACCYFTTYGALVYYQFLTMPAAFVIMVALTVFTIVQSLYYNRIEIAVVGLVGAYGIPFLVSNNTGRIDLFMAYILIINTAVAFLGFRKGWNAVTRLALVITWSLYLGWLLLGYSPAARLFTAVFFGIAFYLLFMAAALAGRIIRRRPLTATEVLQVALLNGLLYLAAVFVYSPDNFEPVMETGLMLVLVAGLAAVCRTILRDEERLFRFLTIEALGLLVLYIGLRWDGVTVTLLWICVSVLLFVAGVYSRLSWVRICSVLLIGGTLLKLITFDAVRFSTGQRIISFIIIGILLLVGSFYYQRFNTVVKNKTGRT